MSTGAPVLLHPTCSLQLACSDNLIAYSLHSARQLMSPNPFQQHCSDMMLAGNADKPSEKYLKACKLAAALAPATHYTVDEKRNTILVTDDGYEAAEDVLGVRS